MKIWVENIAYPNVQHTDDDLSATHTDISNNIEQLAEHGEKVLQWMYVRKKIQGIVYTKATTTTPFDNWANGLTANEKQIAADWVVAPYALRLTVNTDDQDKVNWQRVVDKTKGFNLLSDTEGRAYVVEVMRQRTSDELRREAWTKETADTFYYDTQDHIFGFMFADTNDLIQWITNEVGSPYENDGFEQKTYWSQALEDDLVALYYDEYP